MEESVKKYRQVSSEREKVRTKKSPKYQQSRKVQVVYYLCKNRQLEHPHFIEVPLLSPDGLYLRGGFSHAGNIKLQNPKHIPGPVSSRSHDSASSSSIIGRETKHSQDDELYPPARCPGSSGVSPESRDRKCSRLSGSLSLAEHKACKSDRLADASTQTEETASISNKIRDTCSRGVSTDERSLEPESNMSCQKGFPCVKDTSETLVSLIRADASKINSFRILEEEEFRIPSNSKIKASNMLMQLISCGSISVKDHSFGLIHTYRPRFSHSKFPPPLLSTSLTLGELDCPTKNPRFMGLRLEDKEYFSGSLVEANTLKEEGDGFTSLKRSSSYNADRFGNDKRWKEGSKGVRE
ncbi:hypothetical protein U1Q18_032951 [Sarracenia purpurea var. burkii]